MHHGHNDLRGNFTCAFYSEALEFCSFLFLMKQALFNPQELRTIKELCADGTIRFHPKTAERLCRKGVIPAMKYGTAWHTTPAAVRAFLWKRGNEAFRKLTT